METTPEQRELKTLVEELDAINIALPQIAERLNVNTSYVKNRVYGRVRTKKGFILKIKQAFPELKGFAMMQGNAEKQDYVLFLEREIEKLKKENEEYRKTILQIAIDKNN